MKVKVFKKTMTIRPPKDNVGLIESLEFLAELDGRTLNNYVVRLLHTHITANGGTYKKSKEKAK